MNQSHKQTNKYFAINSVKSSANPSFPHKKGQVPFRVSDKELREESYRWDSIFRQFIKIKK